MPITPRKAKTGRIPPIEHRANAHRASPADARTGRAACQLRPERAKALSPGQSPWGETATHQTLALKGQKKHTLCAPAAPARRTPEKTCAIPRAEKQVGPSARFKHHPTHPIEPHAHMPTARRAGRPTPLTPLQQERKKGHIPPPWSMGEIRKGQPALQRRGGAGRPTYPSPARKKTGHIPRHGAWAKSEGRNQPSRRGEKGVGKHEKRSLGH